MTTISRDSDSSDYSAEERLTILMELSKIDAKKGDNIKRTRENENL